MYVNTKNIITKYIYIYIYIYTTKIFQRNFTISLYTICITLVHIFRDYLYIRLLIPLHVIAYSWGTKDVLKMMRRLTSTTNNDYEQIIADKQLNGKMLSRLIHINFNINIDLLYYTI